MLDFSSGITLESSLRSPLTMSNTTGAPCGGDTNLSQCGSSFPLDFCCGQGTTCVNLATTEPAVLCCPAGPDCSYISPITCNPAAWNATLVPSGQLHATGSLTLRNCGSGCCPPTYECNGSFCIAQKEYEQRTSTTVATLSSTIASTLRKALEHRRGNDAIPCKSALSPADRGAKLRG